MDEEDIADCIGRIFNMAMTNCRYPYDLIERRFSSSFLISELEEGRDKLFIIKSEYELFSLIFNISDYIDVTDDQLHAIYYWVGTSYTKLFFHFHISFSQILVFIPLEDMVSLYSLYHEMSDDDLFDFFIKISGEINILNALRKKAKLRVIELSKLSKISTNTLKNYLKNNKALFNMSFANGMALSKTFGITPKVFLRQLP